MRLRLLFVTAAVLLSSVLVGAAKGAPGDVIFEDDFESYTLGTHPAPWGEIFGRDDDVVTNVWAAGGLQSLVSESTDGSDPKYPVVDLSGQLTGCVSYEAVLAVDGTPESTAGIGFVIEDPRYPGQARLENAVVFRADGKIMWYGRTSAQIGSWTPGSPQTFTVKAEVGFVSGKADVYIGGSLEGEDLVAWPATIPASSVYGEEVALDKFGFGLAQGFTTAGPGYVYIDNVVLTECPVCAEAEVKVRPKTVNLKSRGRVMTAYIDLPSGLDVRDIDLSSVYIQRGDSAKVYALGWPYSYRDYDLDGDKEMMVKFPRQDVHAILEVGNAVVVTVGGSFTDLNCFEATDTLRVIEPGKPKNYQYQYEHQNQNTNGNGP